MRNETGLEPAPDGLPGVEVPPRGSRGTPFPRLLARFGNRMVVRQFRKKGTARTQGGLHAFLLETTGAQTGETRRAVLGYIEASDDAWLVIASAVGAARHPAWLHNLAKTPDATIDFGGGRRVPVRARTLAGAELDAAWDRIGREAPEYTRYQAKTDRAIPVVRLEARTTSEG